MYATTAPDPASPFGSTQISHSKLRRRIEAAFRKPRKPVRYERQWEDPGVHGHGRQVHLRGSKTPQIIGEARGSERRIPRRVGDTRVFGLPPAPKGSLLEVAIVLGVVAGAGAVALYAWRRKPLLAEEIAPNVRTIPDWAMT